MLLGKQEIHEYFIVSMCLIPNFIRLSMLIQSDCSSENYHITYAQTYLYHTKTTLHPDTHKTCYLYLNDQLWEMSQLLATLTSHSTICCLHNPSSLLGSLDGAASFKRQSVITASWSRSHASGLFTTKLSITLLHQSGSFLEKGFTSSLRSSSN